MAKAFDRVRNADQRSDLFVKTPYWSPDVETQYESWLERQDITNPWGSVAHYVSDDISVSFKPFNGSICCTLTHMAHKDAGQPCLITGWSDDAADALAVATFKLAVLLDGQWVSVEGQGRSKRH